MSNKYRFIFMAKMFKSDKYIIGFYVNDSLGHQIVINDGSCFNIEPETLCICTGLKAHKSYSGNSDDDKLIFENDYVQFRGIKYKVIWDKYFCQFYAEYYDSVFKRQYKRLCEINQYEIVEG